MCFVKLDRNNDLLWSSMVLPVFRGNKLDGFIFGTKQCSEIFINEGDKEQLKSTFEDWTTIDQLLLGWLYNTMIVEVASQVIGCRMLAELWVAVMDLARANTRSRVRMYKSGLQRLRKGTLKMEEYLNKLKTLFDNLYMARSPIFLVDLIT